MSYDGTVRNGVIVLTDGAVLPEGTLVRIEAPSIVPATEVTQTEFMSGVLEIARTLSGLPCDLARQHDHYLHGRPKQ